MSKRGLLAIVSGPAGSGKTSLALAALERNPSDIVRAITVTTREPRPEEKEGVDYFFMTKSEFEQKCGDDFFAEHVEFNGNYYGTPRHELDRLLRENKTVLLVIDVVGATDIRRTYSNSTGIYVLPPCYESLRQRLHDRGTAPDDLDSRLSIALREINHIPEYDYFVINDYFEKAYSDFITILRVAKAHAVRGNERDLWRAGRFNEYHTDL